MKSKPAARQRMTAEQIGLQTLWSLVQGSPLATFAVDRDALILLWNQAAEGLFGWAEQEILGHKNPIVP